MIGNVKIRVIINFAFIQSAFTHNCFEYFKIPSIHKFSFLSFYEQTSFKDSFNKYISKIFLNEGEEEILQLKGQTHIGRKRKLLKGREINLKNYQSNRYSIFYFLLSKYHKSWRGVSDVHLSSTFYSVFF